MGEKTYHLRAGDFGKPTLLFCGSMQFEEPSLQALLQLMPPVLLARGLGTRDTLMPALLEAMAEEVTGARVGAATVLTRLADVLVARILRAWMETQRDVSTGWLAALRDPKIGRAIAAIHRNPGNGWSIEALAGIAHTSRSRFAERFTALVGMPVARYIAHWRMHLASRWLRNDRIKVSAAAARLGYESDASFSRAFKRVHGFAPSRLRRTRAHT